MANWSNDLFGEENGEVRENLEIIGIWREKYKKSRDRGLYDEKSQKK